MVIVSAGKPNFFLQKQPAFEVVNEQGLLKPVVESLKQGGIYVGGHAGMVEEAFGLGGREIMYVGDHRVSNFHYRSPFAYLRSTRSSLPHDGGIIEGPSKWEIEG
jgi:hypothetical protein